MVRVTPFLPLASALAATTTANLAASTTATANLAASTTANREESYSPLVPLKRDLLTCEQTYGTGWTQCGNTDTTFCYNPSEGQVRSPAPLRSSEDPLDFIRMRL